MLSVDVLSVVMVNAIMLSVVAPFSILFASFSDAAYVTYSCRKALIFCQGFKLIQFSDSSHILPKLYCKLLVAANCKIDNLISV